MTPWRVGGVFRISLRATNRDETEVTISGVGFVKRDVERVVAELRRVGPGEGPRPPSRSPRADM
jgi:hypothetical protein